jgi:hypothetical protein
MLDGETFPVAHWIQTQVIYFLKKESLINPEIRLSFVYTPIYFSLYSQQFDCRHLKDMDK